MRYERWENGSDFDYPAEMRNPPGAELFGTGATFWHSGRGCLRALAVTQRDRLRRVLVPSFYCPDIAYSLQATGVKVIAYRDVPDQPLRLPDDALRPGDAVVISNTFGIRPKVSLNQVPEGVIVIEDHTHDPFSEWARTSSADFCFASLRKWLPLPDGAVMWSSSRQILPQALALTAPQAEITLARLSAMVLKSAYLAGAIVSKDNYRILFAQAEAILGQVEPGPMSEIARALLSHSPVIDWRARRLANWKVLSSEIRRRVGDTFRILDPALGCVPFAVVLVAQNATVRTAVLDALKSRNVYAAVLWPLTTAAINVIPGIAAEDVDLSERTLALHCDHRYGTDDMLRVAGFVGNLVAAAR